MSGSDVLQYVVQGGALGLLTLVLWKVVLPLVSAVQDMRAQLAVMSTLLSELSTDVYNARCRYGAPSAGAMRAIRPPSNPNIGGQHGT